MTEESTQALLARVAGELGIATEVDVERFDNVVAMAEHAFAEFRDFPAFSSLGHTLTFGDLDELSSRFGAWLQHCTDLEPGDRIAVQMPNLIQYPVVTLGALRAGLVVVNTNPLYSEREIEHQFNDAGVKALVVQANVAQNAANVLPRTGVKYTVVTELADLHKPFKRFVINKVAKYIKKMVPPFDIPGAVTLNDALESGSRHRLEPVPQMRDSLAMLQYTGGTTGVAKGAMLSHGNLVANALQVHEVLDTHPIGDEPQTVVQPLPVYHIYAFMTALYSMVNGSHMVLVPNPRDLDSVVAAIRDYKPTMFCGLNTLFVALCNNETFRKLDFSSLKVTLSGGMALTHAAAERWEEVTGCPVAEGYGLTETSPVVSTNPGNRIVLGSIGVPVPNTLVRIEDDDGNILPVETAGELCVKGPQVMQGYWQRPDETAKVIDAEGYFRTGDIAKVREDGFLQIVDRKKDMIVVSGFNVYPNELEDVLYKHPDVLECAAVGIPDETTGEVIKMFVVSKSGKLTAEEVREFCRRSLTAYKVPKLVEFRGELPKTNVGKILRRELRDKP
ncbi:AMP-binding protein [Parahaliea mediterranea]|uniref:Long-chain-fatty-acid--CoA ligase n=1 Tax=Parahaliea mediterranea TaxID=651086 RepID=A0A939DEA6_9GAMM|nr:AMP-binding protein [Parahaliea mediterranea]MBN7796685.1 AMP-binding protein [Parahaliea mediterranea]